MTTKITLLVDEKLKYNLEKLLGEKLEAQVDFDEFFNWILFRYDLLFRDRHHMPVVIKKLEEIKNTKLEGNVTEVSFNAKKELVKRAQILTGTNLRIEKDESRAVTCAIREYAMNFVTPDSIADRLQPENEYGYKDSRKIQDKEKKKLGLQLLGSLYLREAFMKDGCDVTTLSDVLAKETYVNNYDMSVMAKTLRAYHHKTILMSATMLDPAGSKGILYRLNEKEEDMMRFVEKQYSMKCCHVVRDMYSEDIIRYDFIMCPNTEEELRWSILTGNVCYVSVCGNRPQNGSAGSGFLHPSGQHFQDGGFVLL